MLNRITPYFSSPIIECEIKENTDKLKEEVSYIKSDKQGGSNSNEYRVLEKYPRIKKILLNEFKTIATNQFQYNHDFAISTSWITVTEKGEDCQFHCHHNSFYSGVYYFDDYNENCAQIEFLNPLHHHSDFHLIGQDHTLYNLRSAVYTPKKDLLLFFPSYLFHGIQLHNDDSIRKSLAFNIVPIGEYGEHDSRYNTSWIR